MSTDTLTQDELRPPVADVEFFDTVVIGGGQAGLSMGHHLARLGRPFVVLDAHPRVGDAWRRRWDSLTLFTPSAHNGLPGMKFPKPGWSFPTKDEMADYLEAYAERFELPVRTGVRVDALGRTRDRFVIAAGEQRFEADNVVIATGMFQAPRVPEFADRLDPRIVQLHSSEYRNREQLREGDVLVVGAGNSGADIALDVAAGHRTWIAGDHPGHLPINTIGLSGRLAFPVIWKVWTHLLNTSTPIGRRAQPKVLAEAEPLIRWKPKHLAAAGIERVPRVTAAAGGLPELADGRVMDVANVIWCTGYRTRLEWLDLPVPDEGAPPARGVVDGEPGLFVLGRQFQYAFNSHTVGGVGRDAGFIARRIAAQPVR
jgi:putative flavoprotein involved in K+ transport